MGIKVQEYLAERQTGVDHYDDFLKLSIDLTFDIWSAPQIAIQVGERFAYARIIVSFGTWIYSKLFLGLTSADTAQVQQLRHSLGAEMFVKGMRSFSYPKIGYENA